MDRNCLDKRGKVLLKELETLLSNPRAEEIIANDWLHDGNLPMPSLDLIRYLGARMVSGHGIKLKAAETERYALISLLVEFLKNEDEAERVASIPRMLRGLDSFRFLHEGKVGSYDIFAHEWLPILFIFLYPDAPQNHPNAIAYKAGERIIARGLLETMTLRAVFTMDHKRLESLSKATKQIRSNRYQKPTVKNRIKGEILRWLPLLSEHLKRLPSRSELEQFIRAYASWNGEKEYATRANAWSDSFRDLSYPAAPRKIRIDREAIEKLARQMSEYHTG